MEECEAAVHTKDEPRMLDFPEQHVNHTFGHLQNHTEHGGQCTVPEAGDLFQCAQRGAREAAQLSRHKVNHVVGDALGPDPIHVPPQARRVGVEHERPLVRQSGDKLSREERVALGLLEHQLGQRLRKFLFGTQGIGHERDHIVLPKRAQHDLRHPPPGVANRPQRTHERVRGTDLVVAIRTDQQQVPHIRLGDQALEQFEGRRVQPLQVVEEQREWVLRPCEHAEETPEHQLEATVRVLRRELGNRRLLTDDESKLRDQVDHELPVRTKRLQQRTSPTAQLRIVLAEQLTDEALECLRQRRVGNVSLVLVELPAANRPRDGSSALCSSLTIDDLPMPE